MGITAKYFVNHIETYKGWRIYTNSKQANNIIYSARRGQKDIIGASSLEVLKNTIDNPR